MIHSLSILYLDYISRAINLVEGHIYVNSSGSCLCNASAQTWVHTYEQQDFTCPNIFSLLILLICLFPILSSSRGFVFLSYMLQVRICVFFLVLLSILCVVISLYVVLLFIGIEISKLLDFKIFHVRSVGNYRFHGSWSAFISTKSHWATGLEFINVVLFFSINH